MNLTYRAAICCEHKDRKTGRECTEAAYFAVDLDSTTWDRFGAEAAGYFKGLGWVCCRPGNGPHNLCPRHASEGK